MIIPPSKRWRGRYGWHGGPAEWSDDGDRHAQQQRAGAEQPVEADRATEDGGAQHTRQHIADSSAEQTADQAVDAGFHVEFDADGA